MYHSKYVWPSNAHTHVWNLSKPPLQLAFNAGKMHYLCAVKWTPLLQRGQKSIFYTVYSSTYNAAWLDSALQIMEDIK